MKVNITGDITVYVNELLPDNSIIVSKNIYDKLKESSLKDHQVEAIKKVKEAFLKQ